MEVEQAVPQLLSIRQVGQTYMRYGNDPQHWRFPFVEASPNDRFGCAAPQRVQGSECRLWAKTVRQVGHGHKRRCGAGDNQGFAL